MLKVVKNRKGFTLIELLAVIVILAVIALIATPIIMNVINDSKKGAAKDSMYAYINGVELATAQKIDSTVEILSGTYTTKNGNLYNGTTKVLDVNMKGDIPADNGTVILKIGQVEEAGLVFNDIHVKYDGKVVSEGYSIGDIIYFDPTGTISDCESGKEWTSTNTSSTCYKWNVIKDNKNNIEMLLDHNTTAALTWNSTGSNETGPKELYDELKNDTNGWSKVETFTSADNVTRESSGGMKYTINYAGMRARLISGQEIADIGKDNLWSPSNYTGTKYTDSPWLYSNLSSSNTEAQPYGYWTDTTSTSGNSNAWRLNYDSYLHNTPVNDTSRFGLRPIVRVLKSAI